jgi:hypothetical protein
MEPNMKAIFGLVLAVFFTVTSAQAAPLTCPSRTQKGSLIHLTLPKGATLPKTLTGDHRYNRGASFVDLECAKESKIVASAVRYHCNDGTYGVNYAKLSLSPLAFQGARAFPVKLSYLDENSGELSGGTETFDCKTRD